MLLHRSEGLAGRADPREQVGGIGSHRIDQRRARSEGARRERAPVAVRRGDPRQRQRDHRIHALLDRLRVDAGEREERKSLRRPLEHLAAPPVVPPTKNPLAVAGADRQSASDADRQRVLVDDALAPGVNGVHRHLVDTGERHAQQVACASRSPLVERDRVGVAERLVHAAVRSSFEPVVEQAFELRDAKPDPIGQLGGGGVGEGDDEHAIEIQSALDDRAHDQPGDRPGLSGAGVGLEQLHAVEDVGVENGMAADHGAAPSASALPASEVSSKMGR